MARFSYQYLDFVQVQLDAYEAFPLARKRRLKVLRKRSRNVGLVPAEMLELLGLTNRCSAAKALELLEQTLAAGTYTLTYEDASGERKTLPAAKFRH